MRWLLGQKGLSMVEYIIGGALVLALVGLAVYNIATQASTEGGETRDSISNLPQQPSW